MGLIFNYIFSLIHFSALLYLIIKREYEDNSLMFILLLLILKTVYVLKSNIKDLNYYIFKLNII